MSGALARTTSKLSVANGAVPQVDDVHCWCLPSEPNRLEEIRRAGYQALSAAERQELAQFQNPLSAERWYLSRWLMRRALAWHLDEDPVELRFERSHSGRPRLISSLGANLDFNLSHSGSEIFLAVTCNARIGVDLEPVSRAAQAQRIAQHFFSAEEAGGATSGNEHSPNHALVCWLLKEAVVKSAGATVWDGLRDFRFAIEGDRIRWLSAPLDDEDRVWKLAVGRFRERYLFATARSGPASGSSRPARHFCHVLGLEELQPVNLDLLHHS
jgi:4'-phosphopantetheinyl transferase